MINYTYNVLPSPDITNIVGRGNLGYQKENVPIHKYKYIH